MGEEYWGIFESPTTIEIVKMRNVDNKLNAIEYKPAGVVFGSWKVVENIPVELCGKPKEFIKKGTRSGMKVIRFKCDINVKNKYINDINIDLYSELTTLRSENNKLKLDIERLNRKLYDSDIDEGVQSEMEKQAQYFSKIKSAMSTATELGLSPFASRLPFRPGSSLPPRND